MKRFVLSAVAGSVVAFTVAAGGAAAYAASLKGTWSGTGTIYPISGQAERARCRVTYSKASTSGYKVSAKCASTSGKATQVATVHPSGKNTYHGSFYNQKHNASGSLTITLKGNRQTVSMSSSMGSATMTLRRR